MIDKIYSDLIEKHGRLGILVYWFDDDSKMHQIPVNYLKDNIAEVPINNPDVTCISDEEYENRIREGLGKDGFEDFIIKYC